MMVLTETKGKLALKFDYDEPGKFLPGQPMRTEVRQRFPGIRWSKPDSAWILPSLDFFDDIVASYQPEIHVAAQRLVETVRSSFIPARLAAASPADAAFMTPPMRHQVEALNFCLERPHNALLMEMGTGKTKVAIDLACLRHRRGELDRVLMLCPKSLMGNEEAEWSKHGWCTPDNLMEGFAVWRIEGEAPRKIGLLKAATESVCTQQVKVVIVNYDALQNDAMFKALEDYVAGGRTMVVCDESTYIKNTGAKRTQDAVRLGAKAAFRLIMTGSPVSERPTDIFGQYLFLDDKVFGSSAVAFRARYCVMGGYENHEIVGFRNMDQYRERLWGRAFRCTKAECLDLPPKVKVRRGFRMPAAMAAAHKAMADRMLVEVEGTEFSAQIVLTKLLRLQEITSGYVRDGEAIKRLPGDNPKAAELMEVLEESQDRKVIVWCREKEEALIIRDAVGKMGLKFFALGGGTPDKQAEVDAFKSFPGRAVMAAQLQTGGLGFTITEATLAVYFSNPLSLADRLQSEDRCHRVGQARSVTYVDLVAEGSVDEYVLSLLDGKAAVSQDIMREELRKWR